MKENKNIEELFSERFQNFEAPVNPEIWANVATGIGASAGGAIGGLSVVAKIIIAATTISAIGLGTFVVLNNEPNEVVVAESIIEQEADIEQEATPLVEQDLHVKDQMVDSVETPVDLAPAAVNHNEPSETVVASTLIDDNKKEDAQEDFVDLNELANELKEDLPIKKPTLSKNVGTGNNEDSSTNTSSKTNQTVSVQQDVALANLERETKEVFLEKLPNVLSPNNYLLFKTKNISYFKIEVFSVQGKLVFQSEDPNMIWDASDVPAGSYVYQIELKDMEGNSLKPRVERLQIIK